jgi:predicted nuclease with TOPRIM domain
MTEQHTVKQVLERMDQIIKNLESLVDSRSEENQNYAEAEEEVQRLNADRSRLAHELDSSEARCERLSLTNKEVSRRLVSAMETIRAVLNK